MILCTTLVCLWGSQSLSGQERTVPASTTEEYSTSPTWLMMTLVVTMVTLYISVDFGFMSLYLEGEITTLHKREHQSDSRQKTRRYTG